MSPPVDRRGPLGPPNGARRLGASFAQGCAHAERWPLPGQGRTGRRFGLLVAAARRDLVLARLVEAHADAVAISAELGYRDREHGQRWAVWAAGPPGSVTARYVEGRWVLEGVKSWCSGASLVTHALVDAAAPDGQRLFAVAVGASGTQVQSSSWVGPGMQAADTRSVAFVEARGEPVGQPGEYLDRPGFWVGAVGVAACWHGGSRAVAQPLYARAGRPDPDSITLAHLGAVHTALAEDGALLRAAAETVDRRPSQDHSVLALTVRDSIERNATEIMDHVGRALGPAPLAHDADHARLVADLSVYIRQSHADFDRAEIGRRVSENAR
ncbi:MAG: acyl-CoA/acyl-ACP dehydrogenase [Acidimicrobiales bacterium]|nr:acyl-CoA/acyl-ACP dehydrogenase [Acidimicrobiales bacterium]